MSKVNKVNKSNYDQAGRLTHDELAREYKKQMEVSSHGGSKHFDTHRKERVTAKAPGPRGRDDTHPRTEHEE
jgi:hypothetical protein